MLTYANQAIDAIQDLNTKSLKTFVTEESFRKPLQAIVDAQTAYAKEMVKTGTELFESVSKQFKTK
jgi:hypothetical protein